MKKIKFILLLMSIGILLSACKSPVKEELEEFTNIPRDERMDQTSFEKASSKEGLDRAFYTVEDTTPVEFLTSYEELLHKDGWETTDDNKPVSITVKKDEQISVIVAKPAEGEDRFEVIIFSNK